MANEISITIKSKDETSSGFAAAERGAEKVEDAFDELGTAAKEASDSMEKIGKSATNVGSSFDSMSGGVTRAGQSSAEASDKIGKAAERADELDTNSAKATSSLGALSSGFELIGNTGAAESLQKAALATDFFSGVGEAATLVMGNLRSAFSAMAGFITGPWGIAIAGAAIAITAIVIAFNAMGAESRRAAEHQREVIAAADELIGTLDEESGALTENTREWAYNRLVKNGWLSEAEAADIRIRDLVDAMLGEDDAIARVSAQLDVHKQKLLDDAAARGGSTEAMHNQQVATEGLINEVSKGSEQVDLAKQRWAEHEDAVRTDTEALNENTASLKELSDQIQSQTDPLFAFMKAQEDLTEAQRAYNKAVKESGKSSAEAQQKLADLGQAAITLSQKAGEAAGSFDGNFSPAARRMLQAAGLTKDQVNALERELREAKAAADRLDGTNARVTVSTNYTYTGRPPTGVGIPGYAHGGITGAASGRMSSGLTLVGEHGAELLDLPPGTNVHSNPDTERMLGHAANANGGPVINIYVAGSIRSDRDLVKLIRDEFVNGGFRGALSAA